MDFRTTIYRLISSSAEFGGLYVTVLSDIPYDKFKAYFRDASYNMKYFMLLSMICSPGQVTPLGGFMQVY